MILNSLGQSTPLYDLYPMSTLFNAKIKFLQPYLFQFQVFDLSLFQLISSMTNQPTGQPTNQSIFLHRRVVAGCR